MTKAFFTIITCLLLVSNITQAQINNPENISRCATDMHNSKLLKQNSKMMGCNDFEKKLKTIINQNKRLRTNKESVVITIPVVVHVFHNGEAVGSGANISDAQVLSQIQVLNEDFRRMSGTRGFNTHPDGADIEVEFCMAQRDPNNNPTTGIDRVNISKNGLTGSGANDEARSDDLVNQTEQLKPSTIWNASKYMNMWSVKYNNSDLLGYAQFPGGPSNIDGVVSRHDAFGSNDAQGVTINGNINLGRTMTHEVGHYLGLYHTFQGGCSGSGDLCADTPAVSEPNYGCPNGVDSCPSDAGNDMIENYMDYTVDACMSVFTNDQKSRMLAVLQSQIYRASLASSNGCTPVNNFNIDGKLELIKLNKIDCTTSSITPQLIITNKGNNTINSATINYNVDNGTSTQINFTGPLTTGQSQNINIPVINLTTGQHTFYATLTNINNSTDEYLANNSVSQNVTMTGSSDGCDSVGTTTYKTSTEGVILNDGVTNILNNINTGKPSGYSDYTIFGGSSALPATPVNRESNYNLTVKTNTDGDYILQTIAWIDWNKNCSFNDPGEKYDLGLSTNSFNIASNNSPLSITVPATAVLGNVTMRVTTKYTNNDSGQSPTACENNHDAEVEDYTLNVKEAALGLEDGLINFNNSISLYPNPVTDDLRIKINSDTIKRNNPPTAYTIYNILGQLVNQDTINDIDNLSIDVSKLSKEMYFIKLSNGTESVTKPFIKN